MSTIVTRAGKGSPLTNNEVDANFTNLNTDKLESADLSGYALLTGATFTGDVEGTEFIGSLRGNNIFKAQAGEALSKGDAIYISGISGNTPIVSLADADNAAKIPAFGVAADNATLNSAVDVVTYGAISGVDTSGFTLGDTLYVGTTSGQLVNTPPTGESSLIQNLGKVERVHASAGILFIAGAGRTNATPNLNDGNFFLGNGSNQAVSVDFETAVLGEISAGTGIGISASGVISNSAPDQTVALTGLGATSISGTYPNFTISSTDTTYTVGDGGLTEINFTSADNTKLDGIEASADVTDATNVTAAGALMDSEVTNLAQVKAFDSSDYATAAQGTTADAALPKAGGTVTGTVVFEAAITEDAVTLTGTTTTIDLATATNFVHGLTGATTYTFSNPATTGNATAFTLKIIQDSTARAITWPASVDWAGGTAPTLTATNNGVDVFVFYTIDGGTTYYGFTAGQAMA
jgi:hypothetical protein